MMALERPLEEYDSVKTWFKGLREQSGVNPTADPSRLKLLQEFCTFVELDPDQMVTACLLLKEGRETKISIKGRRAMAEKIAQFQSQRADADSTERARRGNTVRSFLIHNGILLQSGIQT
jgi:predicted DNA-binding antitoxin AbrB/MazE fold protein